MRRTNYKQLFQEFNESGDSLRVYTNGKLLFASTEDRVLPLIEFISRHDRSPVIIFDKIMGNAAALLAVKANCKKVYSPLGSQLAVRTLDKFGVKYNILETVPYILRQDGKDICPMEKLSRGKEPEDFYQIICSRLMSKA